MVAIFFTLKFLRSDSELGWLSRLESTLDFTEMQVFELDHLAGYIFYIKLFPVPISIHQIILSLVILRYNSEILWFPSLSSGRPPIERIYDTIYDLLLSICARTIKKWARGSRIQFSTGAHFLIANARTIYCSQNKSEPCPSLVDYVMIWTCLLYTSDAADE